MRVPIARRLVEGEAPLPGFCAGSDDVERGERDDESAQGEQ